MKVLKEVIATYIEEDGKIKITETPLVRCKECKWLGVDDGMPFCDWWLREIEPNVFCSYGERANATQHTQRVESVEQEEWIDWREEQEFEDRWERRTNEEHR